MFKVISHDAWNKTPNSSHCGRLFFVAVTAAADAAATDLWLSRGFQCDLMMW